MENIYIEISDKNSSEPNIKKLTKTFNNSDKKIYCCHMNCNNIITQDHKVANVQRYYYIFCSDTCWYKWINNNNTEFIAQFKDKDSYLLFRDNLKKKRDNCYYSRYSYCGF